MKIHYDSFIEKEARDRVISILDPGSFREILAPEEKVTSPWLESQGIAIQFDDGVVIGKGTIDNQPSVVIGIEGAFQGGSIGEVSGAKIAGALEMALEDNKNGIPTRAVLLLETGGVRLQEANMGLAAIAEIHSAIVALRNYQPVIGVIAGPVGCFGGMSIAAALCSYLIITKEGRICLNGPQVIEQEAGVQEFNSRDREFIWSTIGGEQRYNCALVDHLVNDDTAQVVQLIQDLFKKGKPDKTRDERYEDYLKKINQIDPTEIATPERAREILS